MPDYQRMYTTLFNQITSTIEQLKLVQQRTEEMYIKSDETFVKMQIGIKNKVTSNFRKNLQYSLLHTST